MAASSQYLLSMAVVLSALLALALCGYNYWEPVKQDSLIERWGLASAESVPEICMDEAMREEVRGLMLDGLSHALQAHIEHTYTVWLRDDTGQPARARNGVERGIRAYLLARAGVVKWSPPTCSG